MSHVFISAEHIREHVIGVIKTHFENFDENSSENRSYIDAALISFLKDKKQDPSLRREVIGFLRCFTALDARLTGNIEITRKERLEFFKYFDYNDDKILGVRRILDKIAAEDRDEDLALWFESLRVSDFIESTPRGLLQDFVQIAFQNARLLKD